MTRVSCDFVNTMQKAAVPAVSAVIFWSSRFLKYKFGAGTQAVEGNVNWKTVLLKDVVVRENAPLFVQQKRQSVRDLASKFEKGLAIAAVWNQRWKCYSPSIYLASKTRA